MTLPIKRMICAEGLSVVYTVEPRAANGQKDFEANSGLAVSGVEDEEDITGDASDDDDVGANAGVSGNVDGDGVAGVDFGGDLIEREVCAVVAGVIAGGGQGVPDTTGFQIMAIDAPFKIVKDVLGGPVVGIV